MVVSIAYSSVTVDHDITGGLWLHWNYTLELRHANTLARQTVWRGKLTARYMLMVWADTKAIVLLL